MPNSSLSSSSEMILTPSSWAFLFFELPLVVSLVTRYEVLEVTLETFLPPFFSMRFSYSFLGKDKAPVMQKEKPFTKEF